jgi:uncharacterized protein YjbJ (UPF0337 family)
MNKDQKGGIAQNVKGRVKQAVGVISGDKNKEAQGAVERAQGAGRKALGDLEQGIAKKLGK